MFSYSVENSTLLIYDQIGPEWAGMICAKDVVEALAQMDGKHVTARLNTPGGSCNEGIAIYNALRKHSGGVTTIVDSLAASMGSYLLQAGQRRIVSSNSIVMIHDPMLVTMGNEADHTKSIEILQGYKKSVVPDYSARSGKTDDETNAIMSAETWYFGQEIIDAGFADAMDESIGDIAPETNGLSRIAAKVPESVFARREQIIQSELPFHRRKAVAASIRRVADAVK